MLLCLYWAVVLLWVFCQAPESLSVESASGLEEEEVEVEDLHAPPHPASSLHVTWVDSLWRLSAFGSPAVK